MHEHGFWIPLTILFVLRPEQEETFRRLILRAVGTAIGLIVATALSFWLHDDGVALAVALTVATAFAYGLLTVQYALFTDRDHHLRGAARRHARRAGLRGRRAAGASPPRSGSRSPAPPSCSGRIREKGGAPPALPDPAR